MRAQLEDHQINIFNVDCDEILPFAVVGSNVLVEDGEGRAVRGRKYPWGTVNIEDTEHSDFLSLRRLILSQHMMVKIAAAAASEGRNFILSSQDLKHLTSRLHYENFRRHKLASVTKKVRLSSQSDPGECLFLSLGLRGLQ